MRKENFLKEEEKYVAGLQQHCNNHKN